MKFKVWDSKLKSFLSEEFYFIDCNGKLHYLNHKEVVSEWIFPVFSTGEIDKNGVELFDRDLAKDPITGDLFEIYSDSNRWTVVNEVGNEYWLSEVLESIEKIGSKFINPELLNIGD